mgnify:CR=1 FL=1
MDLLTKYDVDAIFCYDSTLNLLLMKDVLDLFEDSKFSKTKSKVFLKKNENYNTISYIGSYNKLSGKIIKNINKEFNINISLKDYQIIYIEEIESNVSVEYSELSNIGHNGGKFIYILKRK